MTDDDMNKLAGLIVDKIFERQEAIDAEETENYELAAKLKKQIDTIKKRK